MKNPTLHLRIRKYFEEHEFISSGEFLYWPGKIERDEQAIKVWKVDTEILVIKIVLEWLMEGYYNIWPDSKPEEAIGMSLDTWLAQNFESMVISTSLWGMDHDDFSHAANMGAMRKDIHVEYKSLSEGVCTVIEKWLYENPENIEGKITNLL